MRRQYHKWFSSSPGRDMEMLVFGHDGLPTVVFPTSEGRFYEFEDCGMVEALAKKVERRQVQLFCIDSVEGESGYDRDTPSQWRFARLVQYEKYVLQEVVPLMQRGICRPQIAAIGCGLGGYYAVNISLRHPDVFTSCLSLSGMYDLKNLWALSGYDDDCYFNLPMDFLPNLTDVGILGRIRHNTYVLAANAHEPCWNDNERLAAVMRAKRIPVRLDVWGDTAENDWPRWRRMVQAYL